MSISLDGSGDIDEIQKPKIIYYANQTLTALYTRFPHNMSYVNVELQEGLHSYYLRNTYAVSNTDVGNTAIRYILDSVEDPLPSRISKILSISDKDAECYRDQEVLINDISRTTSVLKKGHDGFYVAEPVAGNIYTVEMQSLHDLLTSDEPDEDELIYLAPVLHEALTTRIAAKVYGAMGNEDAMIKSQSLMKQYETICLRAEADDTLQSSTSNEHDKLREGGWE